MGWIIFIIGAIAWRIGMYGMFKKAGIEPWKALVPFYTTWCIVKICKIKTIWFWLQLIPIVGQFTTIWITIIFIMHFGKVGFLDHTVAVFLPFIYLPYIGYSKQVRWGGSEVLKHYKKSVPREWADAAVFAIVAATIIRTFIFDAFVIPSESMEKTLLVNDFLFVNKLSYGPRIPMTPLSIPFVSNVMPFTTATPSYLKWIEVPYKRLPGLTVLKRNDVVVFNVPEGDTIIPEFGSKNLYYDILRENFNGDRQALADQYSIIVHPMDKTDFYIKRCTAVSGDSVQFKNGVLFVNGQPGYIPPESQIDYDVPTMGKFSTVEDLNDKTGINATLGQIQDSGYMVVNMTPAEKDIVEKFIGRKVNAALFPHDRSYFPYTPASASWSIDNYGPVYIPKKGDVVTLTPDNITLYTRLITTYEGNTLNVENGKYILNGKEATTYTIKYNYYWMNGDNRHNSQDSRVWGFVPETCIVGKASLIWFSWNGGPRWSRFFRSIK